jgi:hypothetical protein
VISSFFYARFQVQKTPDWMLTWRGHNAKKWRDSAWLAFGGRDLKVWTDSDRVTSEGFIDETRKWQTNVGRWPFSIARLQSCIPLQASDSKIAHLQDGA